MADPFFDGGHLPPQFNRASGADPEPERKRPDDPELNYDPPEPSPPGLGPGGLRSLGKLPKKNWTALAGMPSNKPKTAWTGAKPKWATRC